MLKMISTLSLMTLMAIGMVNADESREPTKLCTEAGCDSDCPVTLDDSGSGYPNCVVYDSNKVFPGYGFATGDDGGYMPYFDIADQDPECQTIIKSPADTTVAGCGTPIASFPHAACSVLDIKETFMVQFCCGSGDCSAAGATSTKRSGSSGGVYLKYANGTIIPPAQEGPMIVETTKERRSKRPAKLNLRDSKCTANSWIADANMDDYTRPSDSSSVVYNNIDPGQSITITHERSQSFTETLETSLGFEDIVDIGVSFSSSLTEETSDSTSYMFTAPDNQTGNVVFTAFLRCSTGTGTCVDGQLHGEICTGYKDSDGRIVGQYSVVVTN